MGEILLKQFWQKNTLMHLWAHASHDGFLAQASQMHKEYGGDTFYEYVVEVIFSNQADNKDHHDGSHDDSAPVHSHHQCCHPTVFLTPSNALALKPLLFKERATYSHYSFQFNSRYLESLFQPPRA